MIVPRIRYFSDLQARKMITKLTEKLDKDRIGDYEVSSKIPKDVISIYPDPSSIKYIFQKILNIVSTKLMISLDLWQLILEQLRS